jgi:hypothetical protein
MNTTYAFGLLGLVVGLIADLCLYVFFGPEGRDLKIAGIGGMAHLAMFPIVSAAASAYFSRNLIEASSLAATRINGFIRGAGVALLSFVVCLLAHFCVLLLRIDFSIALWLTIAAALFGGMAFGAPSIVLGGLLGVMCSWRIRRQ